jgi:hypothetical protein
MLEILEASKLPLESTLSAPNLAPDLRQKSSRAEKRDPLTARSAGNPRRQQVAINND